MRGVSNESGVSASTSALSRPVRQPGMQLSRTQSTPYGTFQPFGELSPAIGRSVLARSSQVSRRRNKSRSGEINQNANVAS
jgi:hypothetical protein